MPSSVVDTPENGLTGVPHAGPVLIGRSVLAHQLHGELAIAYAADSSRLRQVRPELPGERFRRRWHLSRLQGFSHVGSIGSSRRHSEKLRLVMTWCSRSDPPKRTSETVGSSAIPVTSQTLPFGASQSCCGCTAFRLQRLEPRLEAALMRSPRTATLALDDGQHARSRAPTSQSPPLGCRRPLPL